MAETACLTPYTSKSMAPASTRNGLVPQFANPSPLHGYVNGSISTYTFNNGGGGGGGGGGGTVAAAAPKTSVPLQPSSSCNSSSNPLAHREVMMIPGVPLTIPPPQIYRDHVNIPGVPLPPPYSTASTLQSQSHVITNHTNPNLIKGSPTVINHLNHEANHGLNCRIKDCISSNEHGNHVPPAPSPLADVPSPRRPSLWYEEEIDENLRWSFGLTSILHTGVSKYQEIALLDTQPFGKVLTLDRKMQSAERDEWVYHECLVHPALLLHHSPKSIYIMGGGEGSTAREALRHRSVRKVVMCDIDEEVVKFCSAHLTMNREAFQSNRLELVINDAKAELESREERFDIIVGDLADPLEWGPCYQLYSKGFYESIVKPKLNHGGIVVTQAGPAGILSHKEVFTSIYNTLKHVFSYVVAYSAHVPSYADTWGWVMASDQPFTQISAIDELDYKIKQRIKGELRYLDGATLHASTILNKTVRQSLANEKHVYTEDSARFVYGHGRSAGAH